MHLLKEKNLHNLHGFMTIWICIYPQTKEAWYHEAVLWDYLHIWSATDLQKFQETCGYVGMQISNGET